MTLEPEGATPAVITNHPFEPDGDWWTKCATCGLSEAAHQTTVLCPSCGGSGGFPNEGHCGTCEGTGRRDNPAQGAWCGTPALMRLRRRPDGGGLR